MEENKESFGEYFAQRQKTDNTDFYNKPVVQKAYYIGAYARAVILSSWYSEVSQKNTTFKTWLSNQVISFRNLDRIFEMAFRFEQKLKLHLKNDSEVRKLSHMVPQDKPTGISNAKIAYAFVAGFDDYKKFVDENRSIQEENKNNI